jgi:hypothetical protein
MIYMLLVHHDEEAFGKFSETKREQMLAESVHLTHQLHANGQYLSASPLQPTATATNVRVRDGKPFVTDGPFVETREQLAGYFLIDAKVSTRRSASLLGFQERALELSRSGR